MNTETNITSKLCGISCGHLYNLRKYVEREDVFKDKILKFKFTNP